MKKTNVLVLSAVFLLGTAVGAVAAKKGIDSSLYTGKDKKEAANALLGVAKTQAGKGSWERLGVARVYYLGGNKEEGQKIIDEVTSKKPEASDWIRVGRIYYQAGEWDKAKEAFETTLKMAPKDAPWLAEIGSYYNLQGDRGKAEEYFARSFAIESDEVWSTADVAGSYVGVVPVR